MVVYEPEWDINPKSWVKTLYVAYDYDYQSQQPLTIEDAEISWELPEYYDSLITIFSKIYYVVSGKVGPVEKMVFGINGIIREANQEHAGYFAFQLPHVPKAVLLEYEKAYKKAKRFHNLTPRRIGQHEWLKVLLQKYSLYEYLLYGGIQIEANDGMIKTDIFTAQPPKKRFF